LQQTDGTYAPYATFDNIDNVCKLLNDYWSKKSRFSVSADNLAKAWVTMWNKKKMSDADFNSFKTNDKEIYDAIVSVIDDAINLADALKL
jgi:hypothetical protein